MTDSWTITRTAVVISVSMDGGPETHRGWRVEGPGVRPKRSPPGRLPESYVEVFDLDHAAEAVLKGWARSRSLKQGPKAHGEFWNETSLFLRNGLGVALAGGRKTATIQGAMIDARMLAAAMRPDR